MSYRILIVDDSSTMRKVVSRGIRQAGIDVGEVQEAADGLQGLEVLERGDVDLVLSDVNMPNMNGLEFVERVRERFGEKPPIVMVTTEGGGEFVARAMSIGANGYLKKPFSPRMVKEVIGPFLT